MEPSGSPGTPSSDDPKAVRQVKEFARWCHSSAQARSGIKAYQSPIQVGRFVVGNGVVATAHKGQRHA